MEYVYEMSALRIYSKVASMSYLDMAETIGISSTTLTRYVKGERLPDIGILVRICNMLRISVGNFIHHPDVTISTIEIFMKEEWHPIKYLLNRPEALRAQIGGNKLSFINIVKKATGVKTSLVTYNRVNNGEYPGLEFALAFLKTFDLTLDYFFEDDQLQYINEQKEENEVLISRKSLLELRSHIKQLEEDNRRLYTENKRLQRREKARVYNPGEPQEKADKRMLKFINKVEQELAELKSYLPQDSIVQQKEINLYKMGEPKRMIAAEDAQVEYRKPDDENTTDNR